MTSVEALARVKESLFTKECIQELHPTKIRLLRKGELNPFSDYYGALLDAESFLREKQKYQRIYPSDFEAEHSVVINALQNNLFVQNYTTLRGRLNNRIRKSAQQEHLLGSPATLEQLIRQERAEQKKIEGASKQGFNSAERGQLARKWQEQLTRIIDYGEVIQKMLFALRPQVIEDEVLPDCSNILKSHLQLYRTVQEENPGERYSSMIRSLETELQNVAVSGKEIKEAAFYYGGQQYFSTKAFVKDWEKIIHLIQTAETIRKDPAKRTVRSFGISSTIFPSKNIMGLALAGALAGAGVLYALPSWRETLGLPVSGIETVALMYERGEYSQAMNKVQQLRQEGLSEPLHSYWKGKIELTHRQQKVLRYGGNLTLAEIASLRRKVHQEILLNRELQRLIERGKEEVGEEEVLQTFFDAGYVKRGMQLSCPESANTPRQVAQAYLCDIFKSDRRNVEQAEMVDAIGPHDILYLGSSEHKQYLKGQGRAIKIQYFLTDQGRSIEINIKSINGTFMVTNNIWESYMSDGL